MQMSESARSVTGKKVRLSAERWEHIVTEHAELQDMQEQVLRAVSEPERVLEGSAGELLAVLTIEEGKWLVVVYRELEDDGFVITAFLTRKAKSLDKRRVIWSP